LARLANEHRDGRWLFGIGAVTASAVWFVKPRTTGAHARLGGPVRHPR